MPPKDQRDIHKKSYYFYFIVNIQHLFLNWHTVAKRTPNTRPQSQGLMKLNKWH